MILFGGSVDVVAAPKRLVDVAKSSESRRPLGSSRFSASSSSSSGTSAMGVTEKLRGASKNRHFAKINKIQTWESRLIAAEHGVLGMNLSESVDPSFRHSAHAAFSAINENENEFRPRAKDREN